MMCCVTLITFSSNSFTLPCSTIVDSLSYVPTMLSVANDKSKFNDLVIMIMIMMMINLPRKKDIGATWSSSRLTISFVWIFLVFIWWNTLNYDNWSYYKMLTFCGALDCKMFSKLIYYCNQFFFFVQVLCIRILDVKNI